MSWPLGKPDFLRHRRANTKQWRETNGRFPSLWPPSGRWPWPHWAHRGTARPPRPSTGNLARFCLWSIRSALRVCRRRTSNASTARPATEAASNRQYAPGFMTDLMAKDLALAVNAAREKRVPVVVAPAAQQLYRMASSHGLGRETSRRYTSS